MKNVFLGLFQQEHVTCQNCSDDLMVSGARQSEALIAHSRDFNPVKHLWDVLGKQVCSMEASPTELSLATGSLVPDIPVYLQRSSVVHASMDQGCFGIKWGT